jgi:hypothetical protein
VGASFVSFVYNVTMFDPAVPGTDFVPTTIHGPSQAVVNAGNNHNCTLLNNTTTTGYQWLTGRLLSGSFVENLSSDFSSGTLVNFSSHPIHFRCPTMRDNPFTFVSIMIFCRLMSTLMVPTHPWAGALRTP